MSLHFEFPFDALPAVLRGPRIERRRALIGGSAFWGTMIDDEHLRLDDGRVVRADTLTMSAGDITRTVRRFRAQLDRRGIADEFTIDLSADSTGISADRIAMFDNFSVSGAVSQ